MVRVNFTCTRAELCRWCACVCVCVRIGGRFKKDLNAYVPKIPPSPLNVIRLVVVFIRFWLFILSNLTYKNSSLTLRRCPICLVSTFKIVVCTVCDSDFCLLRTIAVKSRFSLSSLSPPPTGRRHTSLGRARKGDRIDN